MTPADFVTLRMSIFMGGLVLFLLLELAVPYRRPSVSKTKRWFINLGMTVFNSLVLRLVFAGAVLAVSAYVSANHIGLLYLTPLPYWARVVITVVFLDLLLWVWHLLNHVVPLFWRFHRVHHTDLNMDVSTATRFHLGELTISEAIKLGLVFFLGADILGVLIFESSLVLAAQFQHSSLKIPAWLERFWWVLFVPPSMHRIHHSVVIKERNSNYGTILSVWDRILGTLIQDTDQGRIKIGVGGHFEQKKLGLGHLLIMPFTRYVN
ncbi:MAG: sterol desaturase family protein [Desulfarculus sp.]|nr:sterol desaturase family protein [Pseudomonadota bacterium]MBV1717374.1 sterol desaturase family protein [Desulfarculus sp.]MBU4575356.1 sterol desaturase family protein [Pseudomonadota bacterium]MBU4596189.1 sterol desaturase family protein [Pseudomonadota bacterium]MBV1739825.1 sterol desaturase family protein [Desulfarculus sp.]